MKTAEWNAGYPKGVHCVGSETRNNERKLNTIFQSLKFCAFALICQFRFVSEREFHDLRRNHEVPCWLW